jgi:hypothetical protein
MKIKTLISAFTLKSKTFTKFTILLFFALVSKSYSQNAYSTPRNYGTPLNLSDNAQYVGQIQHEMQLKYEKNQERIQDKFDDIYSAMLSAKKRNNGLSNHK